MRVLLETLNNLRFKAELEALRATWLTPFDLTKEETTMTDTTVKYPALWAAIKKHFGYAFPDGPQPSFSLNARFVPASALYWKVVDELARREFQAYEENKVQWLWVICCDTADGHNWRCAYDWPVTHRKQCMQRADTTTPVSSLYWGLFDAIAEDLKPKAAERRPFDLEAAKRGEPLVNDEGYPTTFVAYQPEARLDQQLIFRNRFGRIALRSLADPGAWMAPKPVEKVKMTAYLCETRNGPRYISTFGSGPHHKVLASIPVEFEVGKFAE